MRSAVLIMGILSLAGLFGAARQQTSDNYVGGESCAACHPSIASAYREVGMARTFSSIADVPVIEDWTTNNRYFHEPSNQHFLMTSRAGKFYQKRYQLDEAGAEVNALEVEIHYAIGSGFKERDYLAHLPGGELVQFPIVWYADEARWSIAPGYDHADHDGFRRRINYRCVFCHAAYPEMDSNQGRYEAQTSLFPSDVAVGVDCERCHGPAGLHVESASRGAPEAEIRDSIVNPARLDRGRAMDVCLQCHLETTSVPLPNSTLKLGRGMFSFRPGESLTDYAAYFDFPKGAGHDDDFNIVHQGYQLVRSACYLNSEMTCTSCHDPHRTPEDPPEFFRSRCLSCHELDSCSQDAEQRASNGDDCVACHMPERRTDDIVNVTMTDHYIQRFSPPAPLAPIQEKDNRGYRGDLAFYLPEPEQDLYLGLGLVRGPDIERGVRLIEEAITAKSPTTAEPYFSLASAYRELGRLDDSIANYMKAIEVDPDYAEAYYNLGLVHLGNGKTSEALELLEEAIRLQPNRADNHVVAGVADAQLGRIGLARARYLKALELDPLNTVALNNLGVLDLQAGNIEQGMDYFERVLRISPNDDTATRILDRLR